MSDNKIEDPKELIQAIERTLRKDISSTIALYEHGIVVENVTSKMIKSDKFKLALLLKLDEELIKKGIYK